MRLESHKILTTALIFISLLAVSCTKQDSPATASSTERGKVTISVEGLLGEFEESDATKAGILQTVRVSWSANDIVYVYQGSHYLGSVKTPDSIENDKVAVLSGTIEEPVGESPVLTFVYSNMFASQPVVTEGKIVVDMSSQGENLPFVLYGTRKFSKPGVSNLQVSFEFATSMLIVSAAGLVENAAITSAELYGVNTSCELSLGDDGAVTATGSTAGHITRTDALGNAKANGMSFVKFGVPVCGSEGKTLHILQGDAARASVGFTNHDFARSKSYSALVTTEEAYRINLQTPKYGTATIDRAVAGAGETVTITATPGEDCTLDAFSVKDSEDQDVALSGEGSTRTFTMPSKNVSVSVTFKKPAVLPGEFSVSSTKKVKFSRGNLYAKKVGDVWSWDFYGEQWQFNSIPVQDKERTARWDDNEIDLFCWGYGAEALSPMGSEKRTTFSDWGVELASELPSAGAGSWRTLIGNYGGELEWILGLETPLEPGTTCRTSSTVNTVENSRFLKCTVNSNAGLLIFPDVFVWPAEDGAPTLPDKNLINSTSDEYSTSYSIAEFELLEAAGCVFLPAAGTRSSDDVYFVGTRGLYWGTNAANYDNADILNIGDTYTFHSTFLKDSGCSVRLVTEVN
jgi:hypothetical protein